MEIESMVANSVLVRAREGGGSKGRSWKWKEMLRFPHISQCKELANTIERDYYSLCVQQPIGKKLFQLFCRSRHDLQNYISFQDALESFETKSDAERRVVGTNIIQRFLLSQSLQSLPVVQSHVQSCIQALEMDPSADVFCACKKDLHSYLSGQPFMQYQKSMFFDRFIQWKMIERQPVTKQCFRQYRLLGKGGFGEVWACQVRSSGMMYACKKLNKTHVKKRRGEAMALNEKEILEAVDSRFVVNLAYTYETKNALCMVLTMMSGGDLRFHIYNIGSPGLERERVCFYAAEVCCGLNHLHQMSIIYRDLKPENILLDDKGHIRISDLGLAVRLSNGKLAHGRVGTTGYMAPEVIRHEHYGASADWWGLGCLIYEMTAGRPPLRTRGEHPKSDEMERRIRYEKEEYTKVFSNEAKDLCTSLLIKDPKKRLGSQGASEVKAHPFFKNINFRMLDIGLVEPPFKTDPRQVYCSDVQDIEEFSSVKGVVLDETDGELYFKFCTGRVPRMWQNEMIETGCFMELNTFGPMGTRSPDLEYSPAPVSPKRSLLHRIFRKNLRSNSPDYNKMIEDSDDNSGPDSEL
ncbi:unnamed protein product [Knipowitschia caucasica]|uniref:G protein-coupled receptor kinase n=1 Tax=Knipowitschia caucasica TaxID=637954 RepID=A0AAV2IUX4_KNICA